MNVFITGAGREGALGYCFVRRYLEQGDHVIATVRKPSEALDKLAEEWPGKLDVLTIDIGSTESVKAAAAKTAELVPCIDLIINNAVVTSPDYMARTPFEESNLDWIAGVLDVSAVGPLRVIQALQPLMYKSAGTAMVVNISSGSGSITDCRNTCQFDYFMEKCALNMATKILYNKYLPEKKVRMLCINPGWMRTNAGNAKAPFDPYDQAERMRLIFEDRREKFDGVVFVNYDNTEFPW